MAQPVAPHADLDLAPLSVAQYHAMRDAGILGEDDPVELLEGLLVRRMTKRPLHSVATLLVKEALERVMPPGFHVRTQEPLTTEDSEPEPDAAVVRGTPRDYVAHHPVPGEVVLVVEVADDSLSRDRGAKLRLYARAGISTYWIVNLRERVVEVYRDPEGSSFTTREEVASGSSLSIGVGDQVIDVASLLP